MHKLTIEDISFKGKTVFVRVDFNVPLDEDGTIVSDTRIRAVLPTINHLIDDGARIIIGAHVGRPKGIVNHKYSLKPVHKRLERLLGKQGEIAFAPDCIGPQVRELADRLGPGQVLLLENLRYHPEEEANDEEFAKKLAGLGDLFVNDAFGSAHRAHASTEGITRFLKPAVAGYLMQKELDYLSRALANPVRPYVAILGGAKISGKIDVITSLLPKVDVLIIGGGMAFTFFEAQGMEIGDSLVEQEKIALAREILEEVRAKKLRLILPVDCVVADKMENDAQRKIVPVGKIPQGWRGLDIGPDTVKIIAMEVRRAKTIVWNGPMGVFELPNFAHGTLEVARLLADATKAGATTIVGGGDSAAAVAQAGYEHAVSHVSTGGGASLEFLEGKILPGVAALDRG